ncbi:MAG: hypothetical protein Q7J98_04150, partial [Kiritimatiellia bacterium]|nr:hypothetical protein [Kiritimatiellia bacterium]
MPLTNIKPMLKKHGIPVRGIINQYKKSHLMNSACIEFEHTEKDAAQIEFTGARWRCSYHEDVVPNREDAVEVSVCFKVVKGSAGECGVGVRFIFDDWSRDNYVIMPGAVYSGNRFESRRLFYPPLLSDPADIGPDIQTIVTDIPRLNIHNGPSRIQLLTKDLTTPAIGFWSPSTELGFWLLTEQRTSLGESGIEINENGTRTQAAISLTAPGVREDFRYTICNMRYPSEDKGTDFKEGQEVRLRFRVYRFECRSIQGLFDRFIEIRKDLSGPVRLYHQLPFSSAWTIQENKYNSENWEEDYGFYTVGIGERPHTKWQAGWVGGGMVTYPLLFEGTPQSRARALKNLDFLFLRSQAPSGFFYGIGDGKRWYGDGYFKPHGDKWHLIRRSSDVLYFIIKQFMLLEKQDSTFKVPSLWRQGTLCLADAFVRLWEKHGQFGQFINI